MQDLCSMIIVIIVVETLVAVIQFVLTYGLGSSGKRGNKNIERIRDKLLNKKINNPTLKW